MSFSDAQIASLNAPLSRANVKGREQSGRKLSYVEGWHVIAEANRIFGFDAWTRETIELKVVAEGPRKLGRPPNTRDGFGVTYIAKVRVTAGGVIREGVGAGHGIDADLGLAHESALKEAETDAMKRALMTFGNPFGLALYDKSQAGVSDDPPKGESPVEDPDETAQRFIVDCERAIDAEDNPNTLRDWWNGRSRKDGFLRHQLTASEGGALKERVFARVKALTDTTRAAA